MRTSALFPGTVALFAAAGFSTVSRLVLLRAELDTSPAPARGGSMPAGGGAAARTVAVRRREFTQLAEIDHAAFGRGWSHDAEDLLAVCAATPTHRVAARTAARRFAGRRQLTAFASPVPPPPATCARPSTPATTATVGAVDAGWRGCQAPAGAQNTGATTSRRYAGTALASDDSTTSCT